jgi:hypothetical protein
MSTNIFGFVYEEFGGGERVLTQLEVIRDVLLSAAECAAMISSNGQSAPSMPPSGDFVERTAGHIPEGIFEPHDLCASDGGWMTLRELAELTNYGEASISAQLRHLRKTRFGGYVVAKRRRGPPADGVWEYRITGRTEHAQLAPLCAGTRM